MKVRMLQAARGPALSLNPGDIHEGDPEEMQRWIAKGIAEPVKRGRKKAVLSPVERAVNE